MSDDPIARLRDAFCDFVAIQEGQTKAPDDTDQHPLRVILDCLKSLNYRKSDIMFALGTESFTADRWIDGKGINPTTYSNFKHFIVEIINGHPQRPIKISSTGFYSWRYIFEKQQPTMDRIWYLTSNPFMLSSSPVFKSVVTDLFLLKNQASEKTPVLIYLYPTVSETAGSMQAWKLYLEAFEKTAELRGTVIGISVDVSVLPWFLPDTRLVIFEKKLSDNYTEIDGYIRIHLEEDNREELLLALDPHENVQRAPWLRVKKATVQNWHTYCEAFFSKIVRMAIEEQGVKSFQVHLKDMVDSEVQS